MRRPPKNAHAFTRELTVNSLHEFFELLRIIRYFLFQANSPALIFPITKAYFSCQLVGDLFVEDVFDGQGDNALSALLEKCLYLGQSVLGIIE